VLDELSVLLGYKPGSARPDGTAYGEAVNEYVDERRKQAKVQIAERLAKVDATAKEIAQFDKEYQAKRKKWAKALRNELNALKNMSAGLEPPSPDTESDKEQTC
jgi:hypothetical protein